MNMRIEKHEALPPARNSGNNRWLSIEKKLRNTPIGEDLVVDIDEKITSSCGFHIEKFARSKGMQVKARKRGKEIWIERLG